MAAEVIRIEIPVTIQDGTGPAIANITRGLNNVAKTAKKVSKLLNQTVKTTGLDKALSGVEHKIDNVSNHKIDISAHDDATHTIADIEGSASRLSGTVTNMEIYAADNATGVLADVEGSVDAADGSVANVEAYGEDVDASDTMGDVVGAVDAADGSVANVEAYGEDVNASDTMNDVVGAVDSADGSVANVEVHGEDVNAQDTIADVGAALSSLDGSSATVHIEADDGTGYSGGGGLSGITLPSDSSGFIAAFPGASSVGAGYAAAKSGLLGAAGFAGLSMGIGSTLNSFKDFEYAMSEVKAISGADDDQFQMLVDEAKRTGATTKFTATESADALKYMAMAGWSPEEMQGGLSGIVNLAASSGTDIGSASNIVTDALTAFGMEAGDSDHFADVLAKASASANTNVSEMGEAFKYVGAAAGAMNYSIEDAATAIGLMSNAGVHASMAGTALRRSILALSKPSDQAQTLMDEYGISLRDSEGNMRSLKGVMENIRETIGSISDSDEQMNVAGTIFGQQAATGILAIANATEEDWNNMIQAMENTTGAAEDMSKTMLDNMEGSLTLLGSAFEGVQDTLGERLSPYIREMADSLAADMAGYSEIITNTIDSLEGAFDTEGLSGVAQEIGDIIASVTASIGEKAPEAIAAGTEFLNGLLESISTPENAEQIGSAAASIVTAIGTSFPIVASEMGTAAMSLITSFTQSLVDQNAGTKIIEALSSSMTNLGDWYKENGDTFSSAAGDLLEQIVSGIEENSEDMGNAAAAIVDGLGSAFLENAGKAGTAALNLINSLVTGLSENDVGTKLVDAITTSITDVGNWFGENGGDFGDAAGELVSQLISGIADNSGELLGAGIRIVSGLAQGLIKGVGVLVGSAPSIILDLVGAILENIPVLFEAGIELIGALKDGIISAATGFGDFLNESLVIDPIEVNSEINYDNLGGEMMSAVQETAQDASSAYSQLDGDAQAVFNSLASGETTVSELDAAIQKMDPGSLDFLAANAGLEAFVESVNALYEAGVGRNPLEETKTGIEEAGEAAKSSAEMVEEAKERVLGATEETNGQPIMEGAVGQLKKIDDGIDGTCAQLEQMAESYENAGTAAEEALNVDLADAMGGLTGDIMSNLLSAEDISARASEINSALQTVAEGLEPVASSIEIDLTQENNVDELVSEVQGEIDGAFSGGFSTSALVNVTLDWQITNPTASISVEASGGTATATISSAVASANGRFVDSPLLSLIGEDGPEYVIPVGADKHRRGLDLWMQAGEDLGVQGFADGYSPSPVSTSSAPVPVSIGGGTNNNNANVKFNPRINVNGMDGATLQAAMNKKMQEYADSMAGELADMLAETYENRPVA